MSLIKSKTVSFNVESLEQKELLEWASVQRKTSFSEYVKSLIAHDMKLRGVNTSPVTEWQEFSFESEGALRPST